MEQFTILSWTIWIFTIVLSLNVRASAFAGAGNDSGGTGGSQRQRVRGSGKYTNQDLNHNLNLNYQPQTGFKPSFQVPPNVPVSSYGSNYNYLTVQYPSQNQIQNYSSWNTYTHPIVATTIPTLQSKLSQNYGASNRRSKNYQPPSSERLVPGYVDNVVSSEWDEQGQGQAQGLQASSDEERDFGSGYSRAMGWSSKLWTASSWDNNEDKCGGVLEVAGINTLSYKYRRPYDRYESCIWTLSALGKSTIKVNVTESYFRSQGDYIAVGYFNESNYDAIESFTWKRIPRDSFTPQSVEVPGPVAFIHFVSTAANPGLGFRLTYEGRGDAEKSPFTYDNYFLDGEYGVFKFPLVGSSYNNNQRTTIVVKALANNASEPSVLNIKKINIEESRSCQADSLNVFSIGGLTWTRNTTFCGRYLINQNAYFVPPRNDPMILTFKSDESGVRTGFELLWRNF